MDPIISPFEDCSGILYCDVSESSAKIFLFWSIVFELVEELGWLGNMLLSPRPIGLVAFRLK